MRPKMILKLAIDFAMTALLLLLMAYMLTGQIVHEWIGTVLFVLVILHHVMNARWYMHLSKGRYTALRIIQTALDLMLLVVMICLMVSGIIMSRHVFAFLSITDGIAFARVLHMAAAYWGFIFMMLHVGLHWNMILGMMQKIPGVTRLLRGCSLMLRIAAGIIAVYGMYAFCNHDIASYLFLRSEFVFFDFEQPVILFLTEYLAMMGLFIAVAYCINQKLSHRQIDCDSR